MFCWFVSQKWWVVGLFLGLKVDSSSKKILKTPQKSWISCFNLIFQKKCSLVFHWSSLTILIGSEHFMNLNDLPSFALAPLFFSFAETWDLSESKTYLAKRESAQSGATPPHHQEKANSNKNKTTKKKGLGLQNSLWGGGCKVFLNMLIFNPYFEKWWYNPIWLACLNSWNDQPVYFILFCGILVIHYWIKSTFVQINMFSIRFHDQLMRMMLIIRYGNIVSTREHYIISQVWNDCEQWRGIYHRIILIIIQIDVSLLDNFPDLRTEMDGKGYQRSLKAWLFRTALFHFGKTQSFPLRHCKTPSQLLKGVRSLQFLCPMNVRSKSCSYKISYVPWYVRSDQTTNSKTIKAP